LAGRRGYGDFLTGHLELPLLAAGIAPKDIKFPLTHEQEEIIFQLLEDLAPHIDAYWTAGSTCPELLIKGELDMCSAWNGRIYDAIKQGAPLKICWECGFVAGGNALISTDSTNAIRAFFRSESKPVSHTAPTRATNSCEEIANVAPKLFSRIY
jgi:spermidine/putrescine-binding protein